MNSVKALQEVCLNKLVETKYHSLEVEIPFEGIPSNIINELFRQIVLKCKTIIQVPFEDFEKESLRIKSFNKKNTNKKLKDSLDLIIESKFNNPRIETILDETPSAIINKIFKRTILRNLTTSVLVNPGFSFIKKSITLKISKYDKIKNIKNKLGGIFFFPPHKYKLIFITENYMQVLKDDKTFSSNKSNTMSLVFIDSTFLSNKNTKNNP